MRQLFKEGQLLAKFTWDNVAAHCIVQCVTIQLLGDWLDLPSQDIEKLIKVALVHDWKKRFEVEPSQFTDPEKMNAEALFEELEIDQKLMDATEIDFIIKYRQGENLSLLEKLQFYVDDIVSNREIVTLADRLAKASTSNMGKKLDEDVELTKILGNHYWTVEKELAHQVEKEIFDLLIKRGRKISSPDEIPQLLKQELIDRKKS